MLGCCSGSLAAPISCLSAHEILIFRNAVSCIKVPDLHGAGKILQSGIPYLSSGSAHIKLINQKTYKENPIFIVFKKK